MFTKIFNRSNPMNFALVSILILVVNILTIYSSYNKTNTFNPELIIALPAILLSIFLIDFVVKKNNINKNDNYAILLFGILLIFIPRTFLEINTIISNLFILLAFRRLASLHTQKESKQKIFDASLYITFAAMFEFWSILFFLLIYIAIIIHLASDIKNWIIPIIGFISASILFLMYSITFNTELINQIYQKSYYDFNYNYFKNLFHVFSTGAFITIAFLMLVFQISNLKSHLTIIQNSLKKIIAYLIIAFFIYIIAPNKNNSYLLYCAVPIAIIGSNFISAIKREWLQNTIITILLIVGFISLYQYL